MGFGVRVTVAHNGAWEAVNEGDGTTAAGAEATDGAREETETVIADVGEEASGK